MSERRRGATVRDILGPTGILAAALPGYELREAQLRMAELVQQALAERCLLCCEAGTGTGKTLAYLVPVILSQEKAVISTGTKNLQEQIFHKDLPLLAAHLPIRFSASLLKGLGNYLCLRRLNEVERQGNLLPHPELAELLGWARHTETGDRAELASLSDDSPLWGAVAASQETRLGPSCLFFEDCFVTRARRRAQASDLVIVNHHLFFADLALRRRAEGAQLLPPYELVVLDEAHQLEEVASDHFGLSVSSLRVLSLCRDAERVLAIAAATPGLAAAAGGVGGSGEDGGGAGGTGGSGGRGGVGAVGRSGRRRRQRTRRRSAISPLCSGVLAAAGHFFDALAIRLASSEYQGTEETAEVWPFRGRAAGASRGADSGDARAAGGRRTRLPEELAVGGRLTELHHGLDTALEVLGEAFLARLPGREDAVAIASRCQHLRSELALICEQRDRSFVYWGGARGRSVSLHASPIDVAALLGEHLLGSVETVIFTSATLATSGSFDFFRSRLGILPEAGCLEAVLPSPFDYRRQALLYLPRDLPEPMEPGFVEAASARIAELLEVTQGRAFLLFTSYRNLRAVRDRLAHLPYPLLTQGEQPRHLLLERFRRSLGSVLFATSSFWEGVDVVGEALSLVVIDKLPFAVPSDPVTAARIAALRERGEDSFRGYQVPLAALALKQGFGRLIRHRTDRGIVAILDRRIVTRGYGGQLLASLPRGCPRTPKMDSVRRFWAETRALPGLTPAPPDRRDGADREHLADARVEERRVRPAP